MKQIIKAILTSLSYVTIPSLILSLGVGLMTGHYLATFLVCFAFVFLIGIVSNNWIHSRTIKTIAALDLRKKLADTEQSVEVSCAYCKTRNVVPVRLSLRNTFPCSSCKQSNLIVFNFTTAVVTEPLKLGQIGANTHA